jgi:tryptophan synthase alpha chain
MSLGELILGERRKYGSTPLIAYVTAGDPDLVATAQIVRALAEGGASVIELGVPFSDPVADGPTNQKAAERALKSGTTLRKVIALARDLKLEGLRPPLVLFTYFNPVLRMGLDAFARAAQAAGIAGVLCVDLPPEEAGPYKQALDAAGIETIFLASPMTSPERLPLVERFSTSVVYYVSRTGVTGEASRLSATLDAEIRRAKQVIPSRALIVGFGISTPEQARAVARSADGVVVGSAIVKLIEESASGDEAARRVLVFTRTLVESLKTSTGDAKC